jgi:hypothetical protein
VQLRAGHRTQFGAQTLLGPLVGGLGLRRPTGEVEGHHGQRDEALVGGVFGLPLRKLGKQVRRAAGGQFGTEQHDRGVEPLARQLVAEPLRPRAGQAGQCRAMPAGQCQPQRPGRRVVVAGVPGPSSLLDQLAEPVQIDVVGFDAQLVPVVALDQRHTVRSQRSAQPADVLVPGGRGGRTVPPDPVDQDVGRYDLAGCAEQNGQHTADLGGLGRSQVHPMPAGPHPHPAQQAEFHTDLQHRQGRMPAVL